MNKLSSFVDRLLNITTAVCLGLMCILIFGNVVLRQLFNSGITWAEELSRYLFVWSVFLGAIVALKRNQHIVVDILTEKLNPKISKVLAIVSRLLILYVLWLFLDGSWKFTLMNTTSYSPAMGMPLSFYYGIGIIASVGMGIIILWQIYNIIKGKEERSSE
jgi:TRAP-type transport system small permease protein